MIIWCAAFNPAGLTEIEDYLLAAADDHPTWRIEVKGSREELTIALTHRQPDLLVLHHRLPGAGQSDDEPTYLQALRNDHPEMRILYLGFSESYTEQLAAALTALGITDSWFGPVSQMRLTQLVLRATSFMPPPADEGPPVAMSPTHANPANTITAAAALESASHTGDPAMDLAALAGHVVGPLRKPAVPSPAYAGTGPASDPTSGLRAFRQAQVATTTTPTLPAAAPEKTDTTPTRKRTVETRVLPAKTVAIWSPNLPTGRICAHLGAYLSLDPDVDVIVLDLDLYAPSMALHLGILRPQSRENPYQLCMSQLFEEFSGGRISRERLDSVLLRVPGFPRLRLLAGLFYTPALSDASEAFVENLLAQIRQYYPGGLILCNLSNPFDCVSTYGLLERAHQVLMIGGGDLASAFHLKRYLLQFQRLGWSQDRISLVIQSGDKVEADTLSAVLAQSVAAVVHPFAGDDVTALRLLHRPKGLSDPGAAYRSELYTVAKKIFGKVHPGYAKGLIARLLGR